MIEYKSPHPPLSFVELYGFGSNPVLVQVAVDGRFLIISTFYKLTPVIITPENTGKNIGQISDLIAKDTELFKKLLLVIEAETEELETRIRLDDPLLLVRSLQYLFKKIEEPNSDFVIDDEGLRNALKFAIEQDDQINNLHYNMVNALKKQKN